jgi:flavin-dependent dehydrogenase
MPLASHNSLAATIGLPDAAARDWDVAVVGAGLAGTLAARQAARLGAAVLLIDKAGFPRWKVCGCCLNAAAQSVLESVGLADLPRRLGARPLEKIRLAAGRRFAECPLPGGVSVSREALDAALVEEAIRAGVEFLPQTEAGLAAKPPTGGSASARLGDRRLLNLRQDGQAAVASAKIVLAADGLAGRLAPSEPGLGMKVVAGARLGAGTVLDDGPAFFENGAIYMASGRGGYVGLARLEDERLDVGAALDREAVRACGGPGPLAAAILHEAGFPVPVGLQDGAWRGTPPLTRRPARLASERLLVLGDAAGYIEPFTGEGMAWALAGAVAVAPLAVAGASAWREAIGQAWEERHRQVIGRRQHVCRWMSRLLRRPRLCAVAVAVLHAMPQLASPLIQSINKPFEFDKADGVPL